MEQLEPDCQAAFRELGIEGLGEEEKQQLLAHLRSNREVVLRQEAEAAKDLQLVDVKPLQKKIRSGVNCICVATCNDLIPYIIML